MQALLDRIKDQFGPSVILTGDDVHDRYAADWSKDNPCKPPVVLRPGSTAEVSAILGHCNRAGQPVVTQGGMTGLAGGATPRPGEWALSLERLNGVVECDTETMTITARAGTPLETVQNAAQDAGFVLPLDLGARGSCTIGGNIATNAGGNQVIQYGMARSLVLGLEAVLADGTIISSKNKLLKNNTGFDIKQIFIGSEGALGVITEAVLRLFPAPLSTQSALCALSDFRNVVEFLKTMKQRLPVISAFEVMWGNYYAPAIDQVEHTRDPFDDRHDYYVLIESEGADPETDRDRFQDILFSELESGRLADAVIASSQQDREDFWAIRDAIADILPALANEANFDLGIPLSETESCISEIQQALRERFGDLTVMIFGHLGDGNLHVIAGTGRYEDKQTIYDMVYQIAGAHHGGIAAEHGIGMHKKPWLHLSRTAEEIALMKTLKSALDPNNILNPGRVI